MAPVKGIAKAKGTWQDYYAQELTDEDALEITANMVGFVTLLQEWQQEQQSSN